MRIGAIILAFWVWAGCAVPSGRAASQPDDAQFAVYYVRPDGGDTTQCTGLADAPYPGSGTGQSCAWDHPFRALPPGGPSRIGGGDTLIIAAGSYRMGYGAPGTEACEADYPWSCHLPPLPSGPDAAHPTRLLGAGWDAGCTDPPELWGAERPWFILNLDGVRNAEIACLEITDHAGCVEFHSSPALACERDTPPYGDWAAIGLYAADAANITLRDLDIHGLAHTGIQAGRLHDWTVENVRLAGNGWAGWDGDIGGDSENTGTLRFRHWVVEWNGCAETYPGGQPVGCWAQSAGGYGDGVGTGATGGDWLIEDSIFRYNTSDGLDLLYHRLGGQITIRRTIAQGNAGNPIKTNGSTHIENTIIIGNCGYFEGQPFTYNVDNCRAYGNALALTLQPGDRVTLTNNTLTGEGDCLVEAICEGSCDGSELVRLRNNILRGQPDFTAGGTEDTCLIYQENFPVTPLDADYNLIYGVKADPCPLGSHDLCRSPALANEDIDAFDAHLTDGSPAINAGTPDGAPTDDVDGWIRDGYPDLGAYEWGAARPTSTPPPIPTSTPSAWIYLPLILKDWSRTASAPPVLRLP